MWTYFSSSESEDEEQENSGLFGTSQIEMKQRNLCKKVVSYLLDGGWETISKLPIPEKALEMEVEEKEDEPNQVSVTPLSLTLQDQDEPSTKRVKPNQENDEESLEDDDPKDKGAEEEISENNEIEDAKSKKASRQKGYALRKGTPDTKGKVLEELKQPKSKSSRKGKANTEDMSELQGISLNHFLKCKAIVKNAIAKNGGVASFDTIYKYVSKVMNHPTIDNSSDGQL